MATKARNGEEKNYSFRKYPIEIVFRVEGQGDFFFLVFFACYLMRRERVQGYNNVQLQATNDIARRRKNEGKK